MLRSIDALCPLCYNKKSCVYDAIGQNVVRSAAASTGIEQTGWRMNVIYYVIALVAIIIDQISKYFVATRMELREQIPVIGDFFMITSHRNQGAAFGILQNQRWFFIVITIAVVVALVWYIQKVKSRPDKLLPVALSLVLGGAIGNFIDRARMGEVVDFFQFNFGSYTFPIFNVADSCIVVGVALIILDAIIDMRREKK